MRGIAVSPVATDEVTQSACEGGIQRPVGIESCDQQIILPTDNRFTDRHDLAIGLYMSAVENAGRAAWNRQRCKALTGGERRRVVRPIHLNRHVAGYAGLIGG